MPDDPTRLDTPSPTSVGHGCRWYIALQSSETGLNRRVDSLPSGEDKDTAVRALGQVRLQKLNLERWLGLPPSSQAAQVAVRLQKLQELETQVTTAAKEISAAYSPESMSIQTLRPLIARCHKTLREVDFFLTSWRTNPQGVASLRAPLVALVKVLEPHMQRLRTEAREAQQRKTAAHE